MPPFRDDWTAYAASRPIPVDGGVATSRQRGVMAESWWSQRFVSVLESYGLGGRMQRGRRYARTGQVVTFSVEPGRLAALVQGSRRTPYAVVVEVDQPGEAQWSAVEGTFRARIGFAARLLAGEVPPDLEAIFDEVGVSLFPRRWRDMTATCSCPDGANPCKHIAAVLYVFADQLDTDPWLLLAWRGRTREQVLGQLAIAGATATSASTRDRLPPWWPLTPGRSAGSNPGRAPIPLPVPPDPPDRVLARLATFESTVTGPEVIDSLRAAYGASCARDLG